MTGKLLSRAIGIVVIGLAILISSCSSDERSHEEQLREVVEQAGLAKPAAGARASEGGLRGECNNPGFDREPPAIWYSYDASDGDADAVGAELLGRIEAEGWNADEAGREVRFSGESEFGPIYGLISVGTDSVRLTLWLHEDWACDSPGGPTTTPATDPSTSDGPGSTSTTAP